MSWGAQNRSKDERTPSVGPAMSRNPKLELCGIQPISINSFTGASSALARIAVAPRAPELQRRPNSRKYKGGPGVARTRRGRWGTAERVRTAPRPAHGRVSPTHVLGTASSPAHRVRSCGQMSVQ
jgi:hypothetical protein